MQSSNACMFGTVSTAEHCTILFDAVTDYFAPTMSADRRQRMDSTLEGVEGMLDSLHRHSE